MMRHLDSNPFTFWVMWPPIYFTYYILGNNLASYLYGIPYGGV